MKRLLLTATLLYAGTALAQTDDNQSPHVPVEEDVLAAILPAESPYLYAPMMIRYMEGDPTLTDEHYYYLYYGYAYQPEYDAHRELPGEAAMYDIFRQTKTPSREEALAIIEAGRQNMTVDPFSPSNINMMAWACQMAGDSLGAVQNAARFRGIVKAITSSGTGAREKSPWHILRFSHGSDIVAAQGLEVVNRQVRSRNVEYIQVGRNRAGVKGYFFNFERVYWKPFEGERVKKPNKWMFNGTPVR
jgi:hypothetical protein